MQAETEAPPDVESAELNALIEEARRRARRRRIGVAIAAAAALSLIAVVVGLAVTAGDGSEDDAGQAQVGGPSPPDTLFMRAITRNSERILAVDAAQGEITDPKLDFYCGDARYCLIASGDQLVISSLRRTTVYDPSDSADPVSIGRGWTSVPSVDEGRVWLSLLPRDSSTGRGQVVEVDLEGNVLRRVNGTGAPVVAAVSAGPLLQVSGGLRLWNTDEGAFTMRVRGASPLGTSGSLVATCDDRCEQLAITDTEAGTVDRVPAPAGYRWYARDGAGFSPQGSHLVVPVSIEDSPPAEPDALGLVDAASGEVEVIPGSRMVDPAYSPLTWSPDGQRLYFTGPTDVIRSYSVGASGTERVARLEGGGTILQLVATGPGSTD